MKHQEYGTQNLWFNDKAQVMRHFGIKSICNNAWRIRNQGLKWKFHPKFIENLWKISWKSWNYVCAYCYVNYLRINSIKLLIFPWNCRYRFFVCSTFFSICVRIVYHLGDFHVVVENTPKYKYGEKWLFHLNYIISMFSF